MIGNDIDEFARVSYEMVMSGNKIENGRNNHDELVESWIKLQCEYNEKGLPADCKERPRYFEDCINMKGRFKEKRY